MGKRASRGPGKCTVQSESQHPHLGKGKEVKWVRLSRESSDRHGKVTSEGQRPRGGRERCSHHSHSGAAAVVRGSKKEKLRSEITNTR